MSLETLKRPLPPDADLTPEGTRFLQALYAGSGTSDPVDTLETDRPWGSYRRVDIGHRYQVKRIAVAPGARLSLQRHHHRAEHWIVISGCAEVTVENAISIVGEGEAVFIPLGAVHRCANPGKIPVVIIEVQIGTYTGEDDIVRLEDVYGRV